MPKTTKPDAGERAVRFINNLTHTKGAFAGKPFNLRPWQERIIRQIFGTVKNGKRQYRTALLMLPRKNGKSELAAAIALYGLLGDGEIGAEVYSAAADRDQASLVFNVAAQMVRNDPELSAVCEIVDSQKRIVHRKSGSVYRAISAEAYSKHGFNASLVIYDELHAAPNRQLWDVLATSQGARAQPLMLAISTAGYDRNSILYELYAYACRVRDGLDDPTFYQCLYEAHIDADWTDEAVWHASNPALGDFRSLEEMQIAAMRAKEIPAQENAFRRLYLNQWTEQAERWMPMALWDACADPQFDRAALRGRRCYLGMDLSSTNDLTALVAVFPRHDGFDVLPCFFLPRVTVDRRAQRDRVPYDEWMRRGWLEVTEGDTVDYSYVRQKIREWSQEFSLRQIGYDRWNATDIVTRLTEEDRFDCLPIVQKGKGISAATKSAKNAIVSKRLRHDGHPVLRWNVANSAAEIDAEGNEFISRKMSSEKIDGVKALIMAVDCMEREADPTSIYETAGVMVM